MTNGEDSPDGAYLAWLYAKVGAVINLNPEHSFWNLCKQLYSKQFQWFVPNDDNRAEYGKDLRVLFLQETEYPLDDPLGLWMSMDCSVLEMLIAFAEQVAFEDELQGSPLEWFWRFIDNLEMSKFSDLVYNPFIAAEVDSALDRLNQREYSRDGVGGLFPLRHAQHDQRRVELWYQASAYLLEGTYATQRPRQ